MSRWTEEYEKNTNAGVWHEFKSILDEVKLDDESVLTSVQELARLRKATTFLDALISAIDPELVPISTWSDFQSQCNAAKQQLEQFSADRNIAHINKANNHTDNLLTYIRPYMLAEGDAAVALREAVVDSARRIRDRFSELQQEARQLVLSIDSYESDANLHLAEIAQVRERTDDFERQIFGDQETEGSEQKLKKLIDDSENNYEKISGYYDEIFIGAEETPSIKQQISLSKSEIKQERDSIKGLLSSVQERVDLLDEFYVKIFGSPESEGNDKGLAGELAARKLELLRFESEQQERYAALNEEINSLLPGATAAGLASAYHEMKKSFDQPIRTASQIFYGAMGVLVVFSIFLSIESIGGDSWIKFVELEDWGSILKSITNKLPLYVPILWLAFYASKRRSECQRLQQEYAHKEALAKSYHSYKQQIEALNSSDDKMLTSLISKAIDTIAYNAAETLDHKHGDKHPIHEVVESTANGFSKK